MDGGRREKIPRAFDTKIFCIPNPDLCIRLLIVRRGLRTIRLWLEMYQHIAQGSELVEELGLHIVTDFVAPCDGHFGIDLDMQIGEQLHSGAPYAEFLDAANAGHFARRDSDVIHDVLIGLLVKEFTRAPAKKIER